MKTPLSQLCLDQSGLDRFLNDYWEQHPCILEHELAITAQSAFEMAVRSADRERASEGAFHRVWADNNFVMDPRHMKFLARPEDKSIEGYTKRVSSFVESGVFGISHLNVQALLGWPFWGDILRLLAPLSLRGLLYGGTDASLFIGANESLESALRPWSIWEKAPMSSHVIFVTSGRISVGSGEQQFQCERGALLYLPANQLWTARLDGDASALILNVRSGTAAERADRIVAELLVKQPYSTTIRYPLQLPHRLHRSTEVAPGMPPALREVAPEVLQNSSSGVFAEQLASAWMCFETGLGFATVPPADRERNLADDMRISASPTLRWTVVGDKVLAAANGHALRLPLHPSIIALLEVLESGTILQAAELVERFSNDEDGPESDELFSVLQGFFQFHGIEQVG
jgi:hypothetical protein